MFLFFNRYLDIGLAFKKITLAFKISKTTVFSIVIEVCKRIEEIIKEKHMPTPMVTNFENIA